MRIKLINSGYWLDVKSKYQEGIDTSQATLEVDPLVTRED